MKMTQLFKTLDEIEVVAKEATPGPWAPCVSDKEIWITDPGGFSRRITTFFYPSGPFQKVDSQKIVRNHPQANADSEFIALANPTTILSLTAALRTAVEALKEISVQNYGSEAHVNCVSTSALADINALYAKGKE